MAAARSGDADSVAELLARYQPRVLRFGLKMCGNPEDAQDVLQDTLFAAARTARDFRGASQVSSWLYAIARSFCIKKRRRRKHAPAELESLDVLGAAEVPAATAPDESPEQALETRRLQQALGAAIAALEPAQREVLLLRDVEGLSAAEVSTVVGVSVEAVKSRLHRARLAVRAALAPLLGAEVSSGVEAAPTDGAAAERCPDVLALLSRRLEGDVDPALCADLEAHVARCARCRIACDSLKQTVALCRATPAPATSVALRDSLRRAVRELLAAPPGAAPVAAVRPPRSPRRSRRS
ncbi:MAG: sigma-70 family RNA polymerase sigma factor [Polyangiaceae bacterium]|nr:sigma-70 family RNA polymerase sigma factor [Polyangiaceae bacterium]